MVPGSDSTLLIHIHGTCLEHINYLFNSVTKKRCVYGVLYVLADRFMSTNDLGINSGVEDSMSLSEVHSMVPGY